MRKIIEYGLILIVRFPDSPKGAENYRIRAYSNRALSGQPQGRGKLERWFRTVAEKFEPLL